MHISWRPDPPNIALGRDKEYQFAWLPTHLGDREGKKVIVWWQWYIVELYLDGEASFVVDYPVGELCRYPIGNREGFLPLRMSGSLRRYYRKSPDAWDPF